MSQHLESPGQWIRTSFEADEAQVFTFEVKKAGWHTIYLANNPGTVDGVSFQATVGETTRDIGSNQGRTAFNLEPGNYSVVIVANGKTSKDVIYYAGAIGVNTKYLK